ncbi:MAG TPA: glycosyltransferase family 2 protein [Anaerolineae bacterium]|nr:glycosyltransferase family 2 protein [Anaerolineae bacterium]
MAELSVVIVSWNVRELLRRCLASLRTSDDLSPYPREANEIIVVDNGSGDGSADMVASEFSEVNLIRNADNRGFTAANNQGLAASHGSKLVLLNPDTQVTGDALATMAAYLAAHPRVGAVGPQLRYPDGTLQSSRRRFPTLATALLESTLLQQWWHDNPVLRHYYMLDTPDDAAQPVDWVVGACLMVRREVFEQVGGLDEGFFMYSEEMDWCHRIKDAGWEVVYLPAAVVIHHEGKSSEQVVAARHIHFQSSKVRYIRKYHGHARAEAVRIFLLATYAFQWMREALKWLVGHKRPLRAGRIRAYGQVLRSGLVDAAEQAGRAHRRPGKGETG